MDVLDLLTLQQAYNEQRIMLCFNGPLTKSLIEEIGEALRNYLQREQATGSASMDVFAVYIELTQNIRRYAARKGWSDSQAAATVVVARDREGRYVVSAGNRLEQADAQALAARVAGLAELDKVQLKAHYKEQLRQPRADPDDGAGLGLIDMARKAAAPLACSLRLLDEGMAFVSLRVVI